MTTEERMFKPSAAEMRERGGLDLKAFHDSISGYATGKVRLRGAVRAVQAVEKAQKAGADDAQIDRLSLQAWRAIDSLAAHVRDTAPTLARKFPDRLSLAKFVATQLYAYWSFPKQPEADVLKALEPTRGVWEPLGMIRAELDVPMPKHRPAGSGRAPDPEFERKLDAACDAIEGRGGKGSRRRKLTREAAAEELDMPMPTFRDYLKRVGMTWRGYLRRRENRLR
jgi:hypothetical protein